MSTIAREIVLPDACHFLAMSCRPLTRDTTERVEHNGIRAKQPHRGLERLYAWYYRLDRVNRFSVL